VPLAKQLGPVAHAILVFPKVTKAGLGIGGQYGEGALLQKGSAVAYYKTTGASFGLQAGAQNYGYAMFFMNAKALDQLDSAVFGQKGLMAGLGLQGNKIAKITPK
jgi:lipid-binding SYLF domain-containing protein